MEKTTTIVVSRSVVNKLCKKKIKIGDTYNKIINNLLDIEENINNNEKI